MKNRASVIEALADVRELRKRVLDRQLFCGYSGIARIAGGIIALAGGIILSRSSFPTTTVAHVAGWGTISAVAAILNFGSVVFWWKRSEIELPQLRPILDLIAPFLVAAMLTFLLISREEYDLLFPMWMWLFGLMNISSRHALPQSLVYLGWFYIAAGAVCVWFLPLTNFLNPWPMALTFFVGEIAGGLTFLKLRNEE